MIRKTILMNEEGLH